jgi:CubicO group peptidase (beta-lactamase class C family)
MRRFLNLVEITFLAIVLAAVSAAEPTEAAPPLDRAGIEPFVSGAVQEAMRSNTIAGVTVAVIDRSGVVMTRGYGYSGFRPLRAVDADTLFRAGSISKTIVWIAIMQLVEQGKISLDDPINDHLPIALQIPDEGFRQPILVRHLMSHSAGFEDSALEGLFLHDPARIAPLDDYLASHRPHRVREPGVLAVYSNYGAALAGALVAQVSGERWQEYSEAHILRPLGMTSASYREPYPQDVASAHDLPAPMAEATASHLTSGFSRWAGQYRTQPFEYVSDDAPAGALSASANDMAAYMRALLDPSVMEKAGVLKAATALAMREPLFANTPELGALHHGFFDLTFETGRHGFGHGGDLVFQHAKMEIYPDEGIAIFLAVNTPTGLPLLRTLPGALLDALFGPRPERSTRAADAQAEAAKVAGTYLSLRLPSYRSELPLLRYDGAFEVRALNSGDILIGGPNRYRPIGDGVFVATAGHDRAAFHERDGAMRYFDAFSVFPADRIGYFEQRRWLRLIGGVAAFAACWGLIEAGRRFVRGERTTQAAALILDALGLLWLAAGALTALALWPWIKDEDSTIFTYPGALYPGACWALLAAAVATPLAAILALGLWRPAGWGRWRWLRQSATLVVFAALAVTLYDWGLLGFRA